MKALRWMIAGLALGATTLAQADEQTIRRVVSAKLGGAQVDGVERAPMPGLWEVRLSTLEGPRLVYTDSQANYIIMGNLYDTRAERNLTEERMQKLSAIKFDELPIDLAITVKRGSGRRVLAIFSDPYCPACQQFERELAKVTDITIHYFPYPVIRPERIAHSQAAYCSKDPSSAWLALAQRAIVPAAKPTCAHPIDRLLALGQRLGVNSTPTLFLASGERVRGGMPADRLVEALEAAQVAARAR